MKESSVIREILDLGNQLEKEFFESFVQEDISELKALIKQLHESSDPGVQRLSEIAQHLHHGMSLKHFVGFMVPFERWLNRSLRDDEFLISTQDSSKEVRRAPVAIILDNIRSAFNVGSMLRSLEAFGGLRCYFSGYTPTLEDEKVLKTSMGCGEFIEWKYFFHLEDALAQCRQDGYEVVALETAKNSLSIHEVKLPKQCAFLVGNERFGIEAKHLAACAETLHIPLYGHKNSLNVSIALGIGLNEWSRQWRRA